MVKVQGPMMSLGASGSLAKTVTFSTWKGRPYVRELVKPANPKSALQVSMRAMFKFLSQAWASLSSADQATWDDVAEQIVASAFNAYVKNNQARWRSFLAPTTIYPAGTTATQPVQGTLSATAGIREITVAGAADGTLNDGWGIVIFRSTTMGFTPSISNAIAVAPLGAATSFTYVDGPLDPDTYYYNFRNFSTDNELQSAEGEVNATVV